MNFDDVDFILSTTRWMELLIRDDSNSIPSHSVSPHGSSLLGRVLVTSHDSVDGEVGLY